MNAAILGVSGLVLFAAAAAVPVALSAGNAQSGEAANSVAVSRGARAWAENCASCHNLRSPGDLGDAQASVAIAHMRVRAKLPGDMARDILAFLRASNGPQTNPAPLPVQSSAVAAPVPLAAGNPARGGQVYQETCVACHGGNGKGSLPGVPDLTDPAGRMAKPDEVLLRNIIDGYQSPGSPMPMPPKGGNPSFTDQDMQDVLAYIRGGFGSR